MHSILIVDDVATDREILGRIVSAAGHVPVYIRDGADAVDAARRAGVALVLLDVVMPGQDGYRTCRTLKADPRTAGIPVVLVTSKGAQSDVYWGKRQGADEVVVKPFVREAILDAIDRHLPRAGR